VLSDGTGAAFEATVVSAAASADLPDVTEIGFTPALAGQLDVSTAMLFGNIVTGSQGQAVAGELLGKGDGSVAGQRFPFAKPPITYYTCRRPARPMAGRRR
jgi:hypothetical protein